MPAATPPAMPTATPVSRQTTAPPAMHAGALTGPREVTPRPLTAPPPAGPDLRPTPDRTDRTDRAHRTDRADSVDRADRTGHRGGLLAGALAVLLLGTGLGVGAFLVLGDTGSDDTPGPSPTPTSAAPSASGSAPAVPARVLRAAMPRDLQVQEKGPLVTLRWKLAKSNDYPIVVQQAEAGGNEAPLTLPPHTMRTTITDLDPAKGYCFTVGAIVAYGKPSTVSWSKPAKCIRGARVAGD
jgi:serine/threonine-protein kinase PknK